MPTAEEIQTHLETYLTAERRERFTQVLESRTRWLTIVLENIYQPHNASACLRSCEAFGIQDIHVIENKNRFQCIEGVVMGADKWLTINRYHDPGVSSTTPCLQALKNKGYHIAATTLREGAIPLNDLPLDQPVALAFGTELTGLTDEAHDLADSFVYLPMHGFTQSFNISVTVALAVASLTNRLRDTEIKWQLAEDEKFTLRREWTRRTLRSADKLEEAFLKSLNTQA